MAGSPNQDVFDVRKIRRLIELMNEHDLAKMDLRQGDMRIQLHRGREPLLSSPLATAPAASSSVPEKRPLALPADATSDDLHVVVIPSPMIGTYYSASGPDAAPYVKVGDLVEADTTICIVEAMKVFNEIQAEVSGKVVAVLVESGEPVEFGQPLFKIDTRSSAGED
jgi:acetyl-CoA carboxylase biotin carboxyl carrier protein